MTLHQATIDKIPLHHGLYYLHQDRQHQAQPKAALKQTRSTVERSLTLQKRYSFPRQNHAPIDFEMRSHYPDLLPNRPRGEQALILMAEGEVARSTAQTPSRIQERLQERLHGRGVTMNM